MDQGLKESLLLAQFDARSSSLVSPQDRQSANDIALFRQLFQQFLEEPYKVDWAGIKPMPEGDLLPWERLAPADDDAERQALLDRLVVVKLNGGLGTTMGCSGPKSLVELRDGLTFMDFTLGQHEVLCRRHNSAVPLLLMNSFNTDQQTRDWLSRSETVLRQQKAVVHCFSQSRCPRIFADTLLPVPSTWEQQPDGDEGWYPPGHGNAFWAMAQSGLLDTLLEAGRDLAFFANIDNTGAIFDERIAKVLADGRADYVMEMTRRTAADVKGGTLVRLQNAGNRLMHLECPQVPDERLDEFCSLGTFKMFNTNNIWVNLVAVKAKLAPAGGGMTMEILANRKCLASTGQPVFQLEQSIGGAIRNFPGRALAVCVPRHRFLPVKSTRDLCRMRCPSLFQLDREEFLLRQRVPHLPEVHFSSEFAKLADFERRIPQVPWMEEMVRSVRLEGDIWLGPGVQMRGRAVSLVAAPGEQIRVPANWIIEDGTISAAVGKAAGEKKEGKEEKDQRH